MAKSSVCVGLKKSGKVHLSLSAVRWAARTYSYFHIYRNRLAKRAAGQMRTHPPTGGANSLCALFFHGAPNQTQSITCPLSSVYESERQRTRHWSQQSGTAKLRRHLFAFYKTPNPQSAFLKNQLKWQRIFLIRSVNLPGIFFASLCALHST